MRPLKVRLNPLPAFAGTGFSEDPSTHHYVAQTDRPSPSLHLFILHLFSYQGIGDVYIISQKVVK